MARKQSSSRVRETISAKQTAKTKAKPANRSLATNGSRRASSSVTAGRSQSHASDSSQSVTPAEVLSRAEADIAVAIESLNRQMTTAMTSLTEIAVSQRGRGEAVVRTAPLDRATATFQRLVAEVVDDHLAEMLPPLVTLRNEMLLRSRHTLQENETSQEFYQRGLGVLDQVLSVAGVKSYDARPGENYDPVIHSAVGEMNRDDLNDGAVAEMIQPGFRTARGKVIVAAKVKVNRR